MKPQQQMMVQRIIQGQNMAPTYRRQTRGFELRRAAIVLRRRWRRARMTAGGGAQDEGWIAAWILKGLELVPLCCQQPGGPTPSPFFLCVPSPFLICYSIHCLVQKNGGMKREIEMPRVMLATFF